MQKAHKAVLAGQYLRSLHCSIVPSMEIRVHSRLILARYKGCTNARYIAQEALCAFCTEKWFVFLNSSCPYLLDNMHFALVQPLYRARISRECTRISIHGTILRCRERRYWTVCTALCAFCTEKGFVFLNSYSP